jgi:hypothetical protein
MQKAPSPFLLFAQSSGRRFDVHDPASASHAEQKFPKVARCDTKTHPRFASCQLRIRRVNAA